MASKESPRILPADKKHDEKDLPNVSISLQQGTHKPIRYFDIMVIGKTGVGKSTTADKLLIATPTGQSYEGEQHEEPTLNQTEGTVCHEDICMWQLSDSDNEIERVSKRLKNLVFCRSLSDSHTEVNTLRMKGGETVGSTNKCELISNDSTNIRVLDVPGFYGPKACSTEAKDVLDRAVKTADNDLSIMRKILHIKMAKNFKFNRIVYFLPETGILERDSQILHTEIGIMENYFGRSIFESMVVVATYLESIYKHLSKDSISFPRRISRRPSTTFNLRCSRFLRVPTTSPKPPIIFISLFDTCETIFRKIKESSVAREGVELQFNPHTCARCNVRIGMLKEDTAKAEQKEGLLATCAYNNNWAEAIPYEESTCHPIMIPRYTKLQKIVGEIAHLITFKQFKGKWPSISNMEEVCAHCRQSPKSRGCLKVRMDFVSGSGSIKVDHTSQVTEDFVINIEGTDGDDTSCTGALVGGKFFAANSSGYRGYYTASSELGGGSGEHRIQGSTGYRYTLEAWGTGERRGRRKRGTERRHRRETRDSFHASSHKL